MSGMDRREFAALMLAAVAMGGETAEGQFTGPLGADPKPTQAELKTLVSGTYKPGPGYGTLPKRVSHRYLIGMLAAGNIRLEMHETIQEPGALHEPVDTHKHSEIWLVREGKAELNINGVSQYMDVGDIGIVTAGDKHWVRNAGDGRLIYFVVTVGPPE